MTLRCGLRDLQGETLNLRSEYQRPKHFTEFSMTWVRRAIPGFSPPLPSSQEHSHHYRRSLRLGIDLSQRRNAAGSPSLHRAKVNEQNLVFCSVNFS